MIQRNERGRPVSRSTTLTSNQNMKRANSVAADRYTSGSVPFPERRTNSARLIKQQEVPPEIDFEEMEELEPQEEHKVGCPWRRARSQSKSRLIAQGPASGLVHPKPWGARNIKDIPCFCNGRKSIEIMSLHHGAANPTKMKDLLSRHEKQASKAKISELITAFCGMIERKKMMLSDYESNLLFETLKEKLMKYKSIPKTEEQPKQFKPVDKPPPARRPKTAQTMSISPLNTQLTPTDFEQGRLCPSSTPVHGKVEANKYLLEEQGLKQMLGIMNPQERLVLIGGQSLVPANDLHHYMLNSAVQVRHHEENTMFLVGGESPRINKQTSPLLALPHCKPRKQ